MTLTKAHIVEALFAKNVFTKTQSAQIIDTLFELIKKSLQNGEDVLISGFGKFSVQEKQARVGRNPKTGELLKLPSRRVVTFKCSGVLRAGMNGQGDLGTHSDPVSPIDFWQSYSPGFLLRPPGGSTKLLHGKDGCQSAPRQRKDLP